MTLSDISYDALKIAQRNSVIIEGFGDSQKSNIRTIQSDLFEKIEEKFDFIVSNPPYKKNDSGLKNEDERKLMSRHEITASLEDFISISSKMLKNSGSLYMVHRPERLSDLFILLNKYNLEPKVLRTVHSYYNSKPKLILVKATKCAKSFLNIEKPLIIYNTDGTYTDEIYKIYNKEK